MKGQNDSGEENHKDHVRSILKICQLYLCQQQQQQFSNNNENTRKTFERILKYSIILRENRKETACQKKDNLPPLSLAYIKLFQVMPHQVLSDLL